MGSGTVWHSACITGASSGLGWELALALSQPGKLLILSARHEDRLQVLRQLVETKGAKAIVCPADLTQAEEIQRLVYCIEENLPDLFINNAGYGRYGWIFEPGTDHSLIDVNLQAPIELSHAWTRLCLEKQISGKMVFIASIAALVPCPGMAAYGASKAALLSFAEAMRYELRKTALDVLTVCPGPFKTGFRERAKGRSTYLSSQEAREIAFRIVSIVSKRTGVYIVPPWSWLRIFQPFIPQSWLMAWIERAVNQLRRD